ncbi:MAG: site-specific integrase [Proteobacteria bacterium]|nr:site-specific integrase [Pseudomonadota bacterium]
MGETLSLFRSSINKSLRIEPRPERLHDLRHWFAVDYLRRCGNIYALQKILGHAWLTTTEIYLDHLDPEQQEHSKTGGAQKGAQGERF